MSRKICFVTGTRAEYGLLRPVMNLLKTDSDVVFQLVVTGSHLSQRHGETVSEIEGDGFTPDAKLKVDLSNDSRVAVAVAMANTTAQMAETFSRLAPDLIVVLGDRYEILATAQAALILGIPVAHIHGGEVTTGAFDDSIRHAITKISNLHFVAADEYARRVIQLGEQPNTVFNVGSLGVEIALSEQLLTQQELSATLNLDLTNPILLITHHPTTNSADSTTSEIAELLAALKSFSFCTIIFTGANADPGNHAITEMVNNFVAEDPKKRSAHKSLGQKNYLSLMKICAAVIGNSSSGIIEAPAFGVPTVNIGSRQDGRLRADSIIDVATSHDQIKTAIETALSSTWHERCAKQRMRYGADNTAQRIADTLKTAETNQQKTFFDIS